MKNLLVLVFIAILVSADAKTEERNEHRNLNLGRKFEGGRIINGANDVKVNNLAEKMGSNVDPAIAYEAAGSSKGVTKTSFEINDEDDDKNESYGSYGNPSGSSTDIHHVCLDDRKPTVDCKHQNPRRAC